ncbi:MAG: hypothetical protein IKA80_10055 [Spirochaetaceae bacterium]|nr:hypothetical protein [Spirochaetaceae bacterium]MBR2362968.1 hypothetical protein [Spirochaetaceae bacterium]MBR2462697.1 hypothetical protein [Spirochaetaceae bacterium]
MKTKLFVVAVMVAALLFVGCSTFTPIQGSSVVVTAHTNFEVLGRVTLEAATNKSGFTLLMDEAKKQYPEADDIINILVDGKKGPFGKVEYIMSAVVIKYVSPTAQ